jgi:biotin synthase
MMIDPKTKTLWLLEKLKREHRLELDEYEYLIKEKTLEMIYYAGDLASDLREKFYGREVLIQGLIEIENGCSKDCLSCGIRQMNRDHEMYTLTKEQILFCCEKGYALGFRTIVLQSDAGKLSVETVCDIISEIRRQYPDCAVTFSLGDYSCGEYEQMYHAGADRYCLCFGTADGEQHKKLQKYCLRDLKKIGFQTGCGFMVGSPNQTPQTTAKILKFVEKFKPDMCFIDSFIPQNDKPFVSFFPETLLQTVYMIALIRLIRPNILLSVSSALGSIAEDGREREIKAGADAVMLNLSPLSVRSELGLYDSKADRDEAEARFERLKCSLTRIGYEAVCDRESIKK